MIKQENIEILFNCFDKSAIIYQQKLNLNYLDGLVKTCENILANEVEEESGELNKELSALINSLEGHDFNKEEIRKAFQYACLKGLKEQEVANHQITPESIGIFFSYLVEKLYENQDLIIFDPLIGSANLITCLANNLKGEHQLFGVENQILYYQLAQSLMGMLEYEENVFYQDILTFKNLLADLIVTDFSGLNQEEIYQIVFHAYELLEEDCFFISIIDNEFFDHSKLDSFILEVKEKWHFFGLIVLPEAIFKNKQKSIFILQKIGKNFIKPEKFLLADIPDFNNKVEMMKVINQLNVWFQRIDFYKARTK